MFFNFKRSGAPTSTVLIESNTQKSLSGSSKTSINLYLTEFGKKIGHKKKGLDILESLV
ncbi:MAG: hypothetical protein ACJASQ_003652 [Crocinitomicaceae bacterium]|jgi:hypothetical protein